MTNETNPGTVADDIQRGADALRYLLNWADTNTRVKTIMKTFTSDGVTTQDRLERLWSALSLAAQSQPAATVQEVGREDSGGPCYCWCHPNAGTIGCSPCCDADDNYLPPSKRNAALTAEPAAKAGDAGVQGEDGDFMEKMVAKRRYLLLASYCGGEANCSDTRPCDDCLAMCNVFKVDDANPTYERELGPAPVAPPSPQPDMGSDEAVRPVHARRIVDTVTEFCRGADFSCDMKAATKAIMPLLNSLAALSPPASQSVEKIIRALEQQMEAQAEDSTPSSLQREKGLVWLEGWFDLPAALSTLPHKEEATPAPVGEQGAEEWGGPLTAEEQAKIDAAWEKHKAADPVCRIPPEGWSCSRVAGHEGPCAATPATTERGRGA